jgi:hypothetical protein
MVNQPELEATEAFTEGSNNQTRINPTQRKMKARPV